METNINSLREKSCPCLGCEERTMGCHSSCEKYKHWTESRSLLKEKWRKENSGSYEAEQVAIKSKTKMKADKHRRGRK